MVKADPIEEIGKYRCSGDGFEKEPKLIVVESGRSDDEPTLEEQALEAAQVYGLLSLP